MSNWAPERDKIYRKSDRLGYFAIVLFIVGIVSLVVAMQKLWPGGPGDKFLVLITTIPLGLAFPLYKLSQHMEKETKRKQDEHYNRMAGIKD